MIPTAADSSIFDEPPVHLAEAAKLLPGAGGKPLHESAILRWIQRGVRAANGERVRLQGYKVGGRWVTSRQALRRFFDAITPGLGEPAKAPRTASKRQKASLRAEKHLAAMGC